MSPRADVVTTSSRWVRAGSIVIDAPAERIFDVLADPAQHARFDGSGTVQGAVRGPRRLGLGDRFGMSMRLVVPYRIDNVVVEFEENRRIAWRHVGRHRWRYELEDLGDGSTLVTETFDGSTAIFPPALLAMNAYDNNQTAILKTLVRLKAYVEAGAEGAA